MDQENRLKEEMKRLKAQKKWDSRVKALRKQKDMKEAEFCRKYDFAIVWFNMRKNMKAPVTESSFNRVEAAFAAEGV